MGRKVTPTRWPYLQRCGFSLLDGLVAIVMILIVVGLMLSSANDSKGAIHRTICMSNLHEIHIAFRAYALENDQTLPAPIATERSWESSLARYTDDSEIYMCAADEEIYPIVGSSYDWRDTGDPATTLSGRRINHPRRTDMVLAFEALPGWHQEKMINIVCLDGTSKTMEQSLFFHDLLAPVNQAIHK